MINDNKLPCLGLFFFSQLIVFLVLLFLEAAYAGADERVVKVGIYENAPKVFTAESGNPAGIFIDIIEYIAREEGWNLVYISGTWAEGLDRLSKGEIDFMPDVAFSAEREKNFFFHKVPVLSSWSQVYSASGAKIQSILDLDKKKVAVLDGSVQQTAFAKLAGSFGLNISLVFVPDYKTMFEIIAKGGADAGITNRFFGLMQAKKYGLEDTTVIFDPSDLFFAASQNAPKQLLDIIDSYLSDIKKDSQSVYYESLKRWTSEDVKFKLPAWVQLVGLTVGIALVLSIVGSFFLKYQVNVRTLELQQINQEMEERIIKRTEELAATMEKAKAADRIKSAFLATMSHELRTPLNSIIGFTGIMLQGLAGPLNQEQNKQMSMVQNSARHLLSLINDVLDISKIEAGQLDLACVSFDLRASLEKIVKIVSPMAEKKGIELKLDIVDNTGAINTDQRRLEQIILNLLNNAVKFTEKGHVCVSCRMENNHYILSFSDTGIGMQPEEIPNLFQPFHQIDTGLARKREGTGLGLSICRKIIEIMGGSIGVESRWEHGSTFTVRIPLQTGDLP